jgi:hypothetical protein
MNTLDTYHWHGWKLADLLGFLPFSSEKRERVSLDSDVVKFTHPFFCYFQIPDGTIAEDLPHEEIPAVFIQHTGAYYREFIELPTHAWSEPPLADEIGKTLKYAFAAAVVGSSLQHHDAAILNWAPTYFELLKSDYPCALLLCATCYYKQALQILRNIIELATAHAFFLCNEQDLKRWLSKEDHRLPPVRGRGNEGMLSRLCDSGCIDEALRRLGSETYGRLNGSVHATVGQMGGLRGKGDLDRTMEFCKLSASVGEFVLRLLFSLVVHEANISKPVDLERLIQEMTAATAGFKSEFDVDQETNKQLERLLRESWEEKKE